eukprot:scaffold3.g6631.t1
MLAAPAEAGAADAERYSANFAQVAVGRPQDLAVDFQRGTVWALDGRPSNATCSTGAMCGWTLAKLNLAKKRFDPVVAPGVNACGKRLTVMPDTGKPWILTGCSDVIGWSATGSFLSSPASLAQQNTFRDLTAINSTIFLLDGKLDVTPVPPFVTINTATNTLQKFSISGLAYSVAAVFGPSGNTLSELTPAMGGVIGGVGDWYVPFPQSDQLGAAMAGWGKPAGGDRSTPVFLDVAVDPNDVLWVTGGVLGKDAADSSVGIFYWDQKNLKFVKVFYKAGVVPGRLSFGPNGLLYFTAGLWRKPGSQNVMQACALDATAAQTEWTAGGPLSVCFYPTSLYAGRIKANWGPSFSDKKAVKAKAAGAEAGAAPGKPFEGVPVGEPVPSFLAKV